MPGFTASPTPPSASPSSPRICRYGRCSTAPTGKLSAGQKTRVGLAKALLNAPELLLLDEPTASLDPDTADWVRRSSRTMRERARATILLASHNMAEVERLADRVILLDAGPHHRGRDPRAL